jgi:hypothetical protein
MNRLSNILSLVLAAQLVVVLLVFWPGSREDSNVSSQALLTVEAASISRLVISDTENSLVVSHADGGWNLPEYHHLPVAPARIEAVLEKLPALERGWPVAQTEAARQRFEVAENKYQRKIQFVDKLEQVRTLYLGTSPGFRKVHARMDGEDAIYAVEFNTFDVPTTDTEWLDQTLLQLDEIDSVKGLDYLLTPADDAWQLADGSIAEQSAVDGLLNGLQSLRVEGSVDIATAAVLRETEVPATLTVSSGEQVYEYRLFEIEDAYYLKRSDVDIYFSVSALDYDRLNDVNLASLLPPPGDMDEDTVEESAGEASTDAEDPPG